MVTKDIENLVKKIKINNEKNNNNKKTLIKEEAIIVNNNTINVNNTIKKYSIKDYPISKIHYNKIKTQTNKSLSDITLKNINNNKINNEDFKISPETLLIQSDIAYDDNKIQLSKNLKRAAEMVKIPDDKLIEIYDMLRPKRASEVELLNIAHEIETKYNALNTAILIKEACSVYKKRGLLITNE